MKTEIFTRQEIKYRVSQDQQARLLADLLTPMHYDTHNPEGRRYPIYNLYIDTHDNALIRHSMTKPVYKQKLRLRSYHPFVPQQEVFLEIKKRYKRVTNKRRVRILYQTALNFIASGHYPAELENTGAQILREFGTLLEQRQYSPTTFIFYDRLALHANEPGSDLRVTFDTNLVAKRYGSTTKTSLLGDTEAIMEIKSSRNMPLWLVELLSKNGIYKHSFSKYGQEYLGYLKERTHA